MKKFLAMLLVTMMLVPMCFASAEELDTSWILEEDTSISGDISFWMPSRALRVWTP